MLQLIVGIAIGYFFKPQIDSVIGKIKNRKKEESDWEDQEEVMWFLTLLGGVALGYIFHNQIRKGVKKTGELIASRRNKKNDYFDD